LNYSGSRRSNVRPAPYGLDFVIALPKIRSPQKGGAVTSDRHLTGWVRSPYRAAHTAPFRKFGFTLAEVLITLGIIGVVAAMTLPGLIGNYRERVIVTQAKKSYSNLSNVLNRLMAEEEYSDYTQVFSQDSTSLQILEAVSKYYNGAKVCTTAGKGCGDNYSVKLATPTNDGNGNVKKEIFSFPRLIANDGSTFWVSNFRNDCAETTRIGNVVDADGFNTGETFEWLDTRCGFFVVDVNGEDKGPNQYGADIHQVGIARNKILQNCKLTNYGCLAKVFATDKLNYKKYSDNNTFTHTQRN